MNTVVLRRKLFYVGAIVLLLIPLYFLGRPSVRNADGEPTNEGGVLARLRIRDDLGQSDLGSLDPASESARLATLGLRGVAATILWQKAERYKREKYFDRMSATVNQLKILQPHFVKVWDFQAHNLTYNVSVEFDNYKHRYDWVKKGIYYLLEGCRYNKNRTELPFQIGDFLSSKIGVADEKVQFRELFRNDKDFHNEVTRVDMTREEAQGPDGKPDNWRSGALWYNYCYDMVDGGARPAKSALNFYNKAPLSQLHHCEAIQSEGFLGEEARAAWKSAADSLAVFGERQVRTSFGTVIFLTENQKNERELQEAQQEFREFCGEVYENVKQSYDHTLSDFQRNALRIPPEQRTIEQTVVAEQAEAMIPLNAIEIARKLPSDKQVIGLELANKVSRLEERKDHIRRYREQANYHYWESRCRAEQVDAALAARTNMYQANQALDLGKLDEAIELYDAAWKDWADLFAQFPQLMNDDAAQEVEKSIISYLPLVEQTVESLPANFPLKRFLEFRYRKQAGALDSPVMGLIDQWADRFPDRDFLTEVLRSTDRPQENTAAPEKVESAATDSLDATPQAPADPTAPVDPTAPAAENQISDSGMLEPSTTPPTSVEPSAESPAGEPSSGESPTNEPSTGEPPTSEPPSPNDDEPKP